MCAASFGDPSFAQDVSTFMVCTHICICTHVLVFVCERKHRTTKRCALFVFRSIDNTVIKDMLNKQCSQIASNQSLFQRQFLVSPAKIVIAGTTLFQSTQALLPCGTVFDGDLVWIGTTQTVGALIGFWQKDGSTDIAVSLQMYEANGLCHWRSSSGTCTINSDDILDTVHYVPLGDDTVRVVPPVRAFVQEDEP